MYRHMWAEINLDALKYNIDNFCDFVPKEKIMAVIKANAYGHGAGTVAELLYSRNITHFAVSNIYEALDLKEKLPNCDIMLLGNVDPSAVKALAENNITACIFDLFQAERLNKAAKAENVILKCHLKLDTGMGRLGINCKQNADKTDFEKTIIQIFSLENIKISGAFTHFSVADSLLNEDIIYTEEQYKMFKSACNTIVKIGRSFNINDFCFHCCNSAATLSEKIKDMDLYRIGISLYGLKPSPDFKVPFTPKPVMTLKSTVSQIKFLQPGDYVSYGRTFKATSPIKVATITVGYADGYSLGLSGKGYVLINDRKAPIIGRVCMDQTVVDITDIPNVTEGDCVTLFGKDLPVDELAKLLGTINYELITSVSHRVPRVYTENGKTVKILRYKSV